MRVIDLHCDTIMEVRAGASLLENPRGHVDIPRLRKGDVGLQVFACYIPPKFPENTAREETTTLLDLLDEMLEQYPDALMRVESLDDLRKALDSDKTGVMPAIENGLAIENDLKNLERFRGRGVRYMTLTHNANLDWAQSAAEESCPFDGLTSFGEKVVDAMNDLGMIVDVSHAHENCFWKVARLSKRPFIASHSNSRTLCGHSRNLTDDQIKAIADSGGMVGINFCPYFLDEEYRRWAKDHLNKTVSDIGVDQSPEETVREFHDLRNYLYGLEASHKMTVPIDRILDHIDRIVELVGDEFVGFGSDFDGVPTLPAGMKGCDVFPRLLDGLKERGYGEQALRRIAQDNFLRVMEENK